MKIETFSILVGSTICNAHCPYCISKMTPKQGVDFKEPKVNWRNFEKSCRLAQINNVNTILLTGKGEATLFPNQLTKFLEKLKKFNFPLIELQTNGLVFEKKEYDKYLKVWYRLGLTTMALSITHYEQEKNKQIFTPNSEYINLEKVIKKLHNFGYSIRLSCTIFRGGIDSVEETKKIIQKAKEWNVEQLSLRKISKPLKSENKEVFEWVNAHSLNETTYNQIVEFLKTNGNKLLTLPHGSVLYDIDGQNVCFTDALTIEPESDNIRQIIFFPDGHLRFDWQYKGAILM